MAHIAGNKQEERQNSSDPVAFNFTPDAGVTLLVAGIICTTEFRAGNNPTFNGIPMVISGSPQDGGETHQELWYLLDPPTGSAYEFSCGNTNTDEVSVVLSTYTAAGGSSYYDKGDQATGVDETPTISLTPTNGSAVIIDIMGSGDRDEATANSQTLLYWWDTGSEGYAAQYALVEGQTLTTMSYTHRSDDWGIIAAVFDETVPTTNFSGSSSAHIHKSSSGSLTLPIQTSPTVVLNTEDGYSTTGSEVGLEFTGTDDEGDAISYEVTLHSGSAVLLDNYETGSTEWPLRNESIYFTSVGQSFLGDGNVLAGFSAYLRYEGTATGSLVGRIYNHTGTFGTDGKPSSSSPIATSPDLDYADMSTSYAWYYFEFPEDQQILLSSGSPYILQVSLQPWVYTNGVANCFDAMYHGGAGTHEGNLSAVSNFSYDSWGAYGTDDLLFRVYTYSNTLVVTSASDAGFINTEDAGNTDPFTSGQKVKYTKPDGLDYGNYLWTASGKDPSGTNSKGDKAPKKKVTRYIQFAGEQNTHVVLSEEGGVAQTTAIAGESSEQIHTSTTGSLIQFYDIGGESSEELHKSNVSTLTQIHNIAGSNSTAIFKSNEDSSSQLYDLLGEDNTQIHVSDVGAISQSHVVLGLDSFQIHKSDDGLISQIQGLVGLNSTQIHKSSAGNLIESEIMLGESSEQIHKSDISGLIQSHVLTGLNSLQSHVSSTGSVIQAHNVAGQNSTQIHKSSAGIASQDIFLNGESSTQVQKSSISSLEQIHDILGLSNIQVHKANEDALIQINYLYGESTKQIHVSNTGIVSEISITILSGYSSTHIHDSTTSYLSQSHNISGISSIHIQTSQAGIVAFIVVLIGENSEQIHYSNSSQVTESIALIGESGIQIQKSNIGNLLQNSLIVGENSIFSHLSSSGVVSTNGLTGYNSTHKQISLFYYTTDLEMKFDVFIFQDKQSFVEF